MTQRINWSPNERVDRKDLNDGTNTLSTGLLQQHIDRLVLDHFCRISSGFRVAIANQGTNPGQFTVFNGIGFDRSGQILQNEDQENTSRSYTLSANGQYFVEIFFVSNPTGTDARAFWDPSVNTGTFPSGDPKPAGQEFFQNVATRLTSDWQIVLPVSTTGFDISTNPNSLKVPVAVLNMVGGVITGGSTVPAQTVLETSVLAGVTTLKVFDSRLFPVTFTATVGTESVTVTNNDTVNGILTLAGGTANPHNTGERFVITGTGLQQFLSENVGRAIPTSGTAEARPRMFQGWEDRGYGLVTDPANTGVGRSDVQIQTLKDQIDFLAAQLREIRFGAERTSDVGKLAPPFSFENPPRYFDRAGGVAGARSNTVSIGDGVISFGDFNVAEESTADATFAAAVAALPAGGTIFVKRTSGTYDLNNSIPQTSNNFVRFIGEDPKTTIRCLGANPVIDIGTGAAWGYTFEHLKIIRGPASTAPGAIACTGAGVITARNCTIDGLYQIASGLNISGAMYNCKLTATAGGNGAALFGDFAQMAFYNCTFDATALSTSGSRTVLIGNGGNMSQLAFNDCLFTTNATAAFNAEISGGGNPDLIRFSHCKFIAAGGTSPAIKALPTPGGSCTQLQIVDCETTMAGGLLFGDRLTGCYIKGCNITALGNNGKVAIRLNSVGNFDITISECRFNQASPASGASSVGIWMDTAEGVEIRNCYFANLDVSIYTDSGSNISVEGCIYEGGFGFSSHGQYFFLGNTLVQFLSIVNCSITGLNNELIGEIAAIKINSSCTVTDVVISNCTINGVGGGFGGGVSVRGIYLDGAAQTAVKITSCNLTQIDTGSGFRAGGIEVINSATDVVISSCSITTIGHNALNTAAINVASATDVDISDNTVDTVGFTAQTSIQGIRVNQCNDVIIADNSITNVNGITATFNGYIVVDTTGSRTSISNNILDISSTTLYGIGVVQNSSATTLADVNINGNIVGISNTNSMRVGIYVDFDGPGNGNANASERAIISNNVVRGCTITGIQVTSLSLNPRFIVVTNNIVHTDQHIVSGISLTNLIDFIVSSNQIALTDPSGTAVVNNPISLNTCVNGLISANSTFGNAMSASAAHVFLTSCTGVHIAANSFVNGSTSTTTARAVAASGGSTFFAAANLFRPTTGVTAFAAWDKAQTDTGTTPNVGTNPSGLGDISLNWSNAT